jgi:hypothetical protein
MQGLDLLQTNLLQPIVLAFLLGTIAGFVKSELELPEAVIKLLAIYLLFSLGMTGGRELAKAEMGTVLPLIAVTVLMTSPSRRWSTSSPAALANSTSRTLRRFRRTMARCRLRPSSPP